MKRFAFLLVFSIALLPSILALLRPGFFQSDDGEWMVIRFSAFYQVLTDGQIPARFLSRLNNEYGYPVANFLYPGFMYLATPIKIIGFDFVTTIKIIIGASLISSALFTYFWLKKLFPYWEAVVGAMLYLYAPYHMFDAYTRGSVGELLAIALLPFVLWQIERQSTFLASLGIGLLLISHNTLALMSLPIIVLYMLISYRAKLKNTIAKRYVLMFFYGLGLASFFWIPAIFDLQYTRFSQTVVSDWNQYFASFQLIGASVVGLFIVFFYFWIKKKIVLTEQSILFYSLFITTLFFSLSISSVFWKLLPVSIIQFPYRLLAVFMLASAYTGALLINLLSGKKKAFIGIVLIALSFFSAMPFLTPKIFVNREEGYYTTNMDTTTVKQEYMPIWVKKFPTERPEHKIRLENGEATVTYQNPNEIRFTTNTKQSENVSINTIYFPGWKLFVDNVERPIDYTNEMGIIRFIVPEGKHSASIVFQETNIRLISDFTTIASFCFLLALGLKTKWRYI